MIVTVETTLVLGQMTWILPALLFWLKLQVSFLCVFLKTFVQEIRRGPSVYAPMIH